MTPWQSYYHIPFAEKVAKAARTDEVTVAVVAALENLFAQYPDLKADASWSGETPSTNTLETWRAFALEKARKGDYENAFFHADNTGVPQEGLTAVIALLFG